MTKERWLVAALALAVLLGTASTAAAQEVRFTPRPDSPEERRLARFVATGEYRLVTTDTVLARADNVRGSLLVLEATVRSAATIEGDVFVVGGDLFLRPGARVAGDVVAFGGGFYRSERADVNGEIVYRPNRLLRVLPREGGWEILHPRERREALELDGLSGLHLPTYRRVDGVTVGWGGTVRALELPAQPELSGAVRFHTQGRAQGEGTLEFAVHPTGDVRTSVLAERRTRSMDGWILGDATNSFSYLLGLGDLRDYYRSERVRLEVASTAATGWAPSAWVGWERASSLQARPLWVLFEDDDEVRTNPPIDHGESWMAGLELTYRRRTGVSRLVARVGLEAADSTWAGDFSYLLAEAAVGYQGPGVGPHRLELFGIGRTDLAGDLPGQRRSALGGTGTLPVLETLSLRGPRLLFASATYLVPVEPLRAPVLGAPKLFLRNAVGTAWSEGEEFRLEDNVSVGVRYLFLELAVAADPTRSEMETELVLGATFPGRFWH